MKLKSQFLIVLFLCFAISVLANEDSSKHSVIQKPTHFIGLQANQIIKQLLNFGNNQVVVNNPYLLTYSLYWGKGYGFRVGGKYNDFSNFNNDGNTKRETKGSSIAFRLGFEKHATISKSLLLSYGLDFLIETGKNNTVTETIQQFQNVRTTSNTYIQEIGASPFITLKYKLSNRFYIGTEAAFNYKTGFNKSNVTILDLTNSIKEESSSKNDIKNIGFQQPIALFLHIKL